MVSVQNLLAPFYCVLGKETSQHFRCLVVLASSLNFSPISIKLKSQKKSTVQQYLGLYIILASSEAGRGNCWTVVLCTAPRCFLASQKSKYRDDLKPICQYNL